MQLKNLILFLIIACIIASCTKTASTYETSSTRTHSTVNLNFSDHAYHELPETVNLQHGITIYTSFASGATVGVNQAMLQITMYTPNLNFIINGNKLGHDEVGTYTIGEYNDTPNHIHNFYGYINILDKANRNRQYTIYPDSTSSNITVSISTPEQLKGTFQLKMLHNDSIFYANGDFNILTTLK